MPLLPERLNPSTLRQGRDIAALPINHASHMVTRHAGTQTDPNAATGRGGIASFLTCPTGLLRDCSAFILGAIPMPVNVPVD